MKELLLKAAEQMEEKFLEIQKIQKQIHSLTDKLTDEELDNLMEDPELIELNKRVTGLIEEIWN